MFKRLLCSISLTMLLPLEAATSPFRHLNQFATIESKSSSSRDYFRSVTAGEKKDIATIVNTLGMSSLISIASARANLKKAGLRIEKIHPLQFLYTVFSDEEMKTSLQALVRRGWIWDEFFGGLKVSLEEESANDNLTPEQVVHFAANLKLDPNLIYPYIEAKDWNKLIDTLITLLPRKQNPNRYNMRVYTDSTSKHQI